MSEIWRINQELIEHLCRVARLELTKEERERFTKQLEVILETFREIDKVDTKGVEPSYQPLEMGNIWREDQVKEWDWDPLSNSKIKEDKYIKGPKIT